MSAPVYLLLAGDSAVAALVGTRIYPAGIIPQEVQTRPVITFQTVAGDPLNTLADATNADHERVQVDCWDATLEGAQAVMAAVRAALDRLSWLQTNNVACQCASINGHDFDADTKSYRDSADFSFWTT